MLGRLMPREGKFFDLFNAHAERIVEGSRELAAMIGTFSDLDAHAQRIDAAERAADKITHETIALLHRVPAFSALTTEELERRNLATLPFDRVLLRLLGTARLLESFQIVNGHKPELLAAALKGEHVGTVIHA